MKTEISGQREEEKPEGREGGKQGSQEQGECGDRQTKRSR